MIWIHVQGSKVFFGFLGFFSAGMNLPEARQKIDFYRPQQQSICKDIIVPAEKPLTGDAGEILQSLTIAGRDVTAQLPLDARRLTEF
ncbi:MAG: hypothetical protein K5841_06255 [Fretibacterium sp.]|nr:hypothetical protein [Fretibacterium sp.]